jgi:hypothetical protein
MQEGLYLLWTLESAEKSRVLVGYFLRKEQMSLQRRRPKITDFNSYKRKAEHKTIEQI